MKIYLTSIISILAVILPLYAQETLTWESDGYSLKALPDSVYCVEITGYNGNQTELRIPDSFRREGVKYAVSSIGRQAFYYNRNLREVILPDGLTSIAMMAFTGCRNLQTIVLPESVANIDPYAFTETDVKTIVVPNCVKTLNYAAFQNIPSLNTLVLGKRVRHIGEIALAQLSGLKELYILSPEIPEIGQDTTPFYDALCSEATVYVPSELLSQYPVRPEDSRNIKQSIFHDFEDGWSYFYNYKPVPDLFTVFYKDSYSVEAGESIQILYESINYKGVEVYSTEWICDDENVATVSDGYITGNKAGTTKGRIKVRTNNGVFTSGDFNITVTGSEVDNGPRKTRANGSQSKPSLVPYGVVSAEYYSLDGIFLGSDIENLEPGIYIEKTKEASRKITVQ